ncbi:type IX secretion system outer membrane channel protein PorV [Reichenbachiella ulvae]|uniref:Type IX secretion system outer membrane channel protein PorV n=1 Tax=Reichenbachiella ulvae TaxID=2980104 RepID=A0ABT3CX13_9BACT|nr:type IX secretion system outer membrane channel protein PorV [Reichenbachiella ulvae]MCV9388111.1 type IX secretion system outer membrane channel protein PorV [Reichenbachiella ulvae]
MNTTGIKGILGLLALLFIVNSGLMAQSGTLNGQDSLRRVITTAVPFISFAPDSRASGMGDVGVATSADANSVHWNNGKLAFIDSKFGASISYSPWLATITNDMALYYLSGYYKIDRVQTVAVSMRYFDLGSIQLTDDTGGLLGVDNPREGAVDATYSRKLSENLGIGVTARYIWSNIIGSVSGISQKGTSVAVDVGTYYNKDLHLGRTNANLALGAHVSNIGQKVTYSTDDFKDFIPINLRLGAALKLELDPVNTLTFAVDFNKLMVPTPPIYELDADGNPVYQNGKRVIVRGKDPDRNLISGMFGSFSDAPDGFSEEMAEIMISAGTEYWYRDLFAARAGYFYEAESKGGRKYFTLGVGFRYQKFGVDFSYLIPGEQDHPLAETIRFSLLFDFAKGDTGEDLN